ncbi:trypsin-like peptidase domain-containing protein [Actinomadura sp. NPDC048032]|uniref:VMAP-C domain-containing protein n=1 Tax=Actinomadura sp. NPDC048032 TaxID=3155747 RepID=UPI0034107531
MGGPALGGSRAPWLARVLDPRDNVTGTAFLISDRLALTCAHLIGSPGRAAVVPLELPALGQKRAAEVLPGGWFPPAGDGRGDVAVLSLLGPPVNCDPVPAVRAADDFGATVRICGFPSDGDEMMWVSARATGPRTLGVDLPVAPGFSGAPVLSAEAGEVLGMVTSASMAAEQEVRMLPVGDIADLWPPLADGAARPRHDDGALSLADLGVLVDALAAVPGLSEPRIRSVYADMLEERLGSRPRIGLADATRRELWGLARWCAGLGGGLHALLEVIRTFHPASAEADLLTRQIERLVPPPLLTGAERRELLELVPLVRGAEELQPSGAGRFASRLGPGEGLADLVHRLEDATAPPDGVPPLLDFVSRLAADETSALGPALRDWTVRVARRIGLPLEQVRAAPAPRELTAGRSHSYLTIQLEEDGLDAHRFLTTVSLHPEEGPPVPLLVSDEPRTLAQTEAQIRALLPEARARLSPPSDELVIEFILPAALLGAPVDQWRLDPGTPSEPPIGARFPIVVRSLDRMRARGGRPGGSRPRRPDPDPVVAAVLVKAAQRDLPKAAGRPVVLLTGGRRQLRLALAAGLPVVFWSSGDPASDEADELQRSLEGRRLADLPEAIRDLQRDGYEASGDLPHRLVLIWDDPARFPSDRPDPLHVPDRAEETS